MADLRLDEVGYWTEIKLSIIRDYSKAYAQILSRQRTIRDYAYIDGFAGAGTHISEATGKEIEGSPAIALRTQPPFPHYHFIDLDGSRAERLRQLAEGRHDVTVHEGDCNAILLTEVFPQYRYEDYRRALCLLDPYKLNPNWEVVQTAGQMKSIEIFLNFMIMDAKMNVLWDNPDAVPRAQLERMSAFWGDDSWRKVAYTVQPGLFGPVEEPVPRRALAVVQAYRRRLREVAGFPFVPEPMPMRNSKGAVVYYLLFASHNATGDKIARAVFNKYRDRGLVDGR
ncbi:MAG TPA: three-Cys-motif partner protein TcmP [Planctomycetota bacterium]|nr:three-Cys-motif partner protein TcmP [Planctomycetota bacterium]